MTQTESVVASLYIHNVSKNDKSVISLTPRRVGKTTKMELGIGSAVSVISCLEYENVLKYQTERDTDATKNVYGRKDSVNCASASECGSASDSASECGI